MNKKYIIGILLVISVLEGIYLLRNARTNDSGGEKAISIGGAFGLSGVCAEWGEGEWRAARMAVDEINADKININFIVEDTQCENKTTVNAIHKLIQVDGVQAIVGPTWGDAYQGASAIIRRAQVAAISPDTAMEALEFQHEPIDFIFSTYPPQRAEIQALHNFAAEHQLKTVAMVWDQDSYSAMMMRLFKEAAPQKGITIIAEHEMTTGAQDFRTTIAKIKKDNSAAVFISFLAPHTKASFLKQARELGFKGTILSAADIQDPSVIKSFGLLMDGVIYTYPQATDRQKEFIAKYRKKYNEDPQGPAAANAYDAVRMFAEALRQGARTGSEIQKKLMAIKIPGTFIDELSFNEKHQVKGGEFEVKTIKNGQFVPL